MEKKPSENKIRYFDHGGVTCYLLKSKEAVLLIDTGMFGNLKALACGHGAPLKMEEARPVILEYLGL